MQNGTPLTSTAPRMATDPISAFLHQYEVQPSTETLFNVGRHLLNISGETDGKLLFLAFVGADQWNSSLTQPTSGPTLLGVYASTSAFHSQRREETFEKPNSSTFPSRLTHFCTTVRKECSMTPGNPTISNESPSIVIHEAKKFMHYVLHDRPAMIEVLSYYPDITLNRLDTSH